MQMTQFSGHFEQSKYPEWAEGYLDYSIPQKILHKMADIVFIKRSKEDENSPVLQSCGQNSIVLIDLDEDFQKILKCEIERTTSFYVDKMDNIVKQIDKLEQIANNVQRIDASNISEVQKQKSHLLDNAKELYKACQMLESFASLHQAAFMRLATKRDRYLINQLNQFKLFAPVVAEQLQEFGLFTDLEYINKLSNQIESATAILLKVKRKFAYEFLKNKVILSERVNVTNERKTVHFSFVSGIAIMLLLSFINILIWFVNDKYHIVEDLQDLQINFIRLLFSIAFLILGLGVVIQIMENKQINYIFILELPRAQITGSYRTIYIVGFWLLLISSLSSILIVCSVLKDENPVIPIIFGDNILKLAKLLNASYWAAITFSLFCIFILKILSSFLFDKSQVGVYILVNLYKMLTPWNHRVAFQLFFGVDIMTSMNGMIKDLLYIMGVGYIPDYVICLFFNVSIVIRCIQCVLRYLEKDKGKRSLYPHITNFGKYAVSIPGTLLQIQTVKSNLVSRHIINTFRAFETLYKTYWDLCEDWSLFTGGTAAQDFKTQKQKWVNKYFIRRPSKFSAFSIGFIVLLNVIARFYWIPCDWIFGYSTYSWYTTISIFVEIFRRLLWSLLRLDNQQATNCESYFAVRQIPILLKEQEVIKSMENIESKQRQSIDLWYDKIQLLDGFKEIASSPIQSTISQVRQWLKENV